MKKLLFLSMSLLATAAAFTGCKDDDKENGTTLEVANISATAIAATGGTATFDIRSNVEWTVTPDAAWATVAPASGRNDQKVTVTATANTDAGRSVKLTVKTVDNKVTRTVEIAQAAAAGKVVDLGDGTDAFEIDEDLKLTYPNTYLLKGFVYVTEGAKLTIEPGVVIKGDKATKGTLIIERGAMIEAEGTVERPIVFTSNSAKGSRKNGDWGGVILCGYAPNNAGEMQVEGGPRSNYGGDKPTDNSGILRYVRIEFGGMPLDGDPTKNSEINGLTMGSVGSGTTIDHIQVSYSGDDSFEWFGGTVNAKNLVAYSAFDDDFDADYGWNGHVQFALSVRNPLMADQSASNGFESDNNASASAIEPYTMPIFSNISIFGPVVDPANYVERGGELGTQIATPARFQAAAHLRRNTRLNLFNSVLAGFPIGLIIENDKGSTTQQWATEGLLNINNVVMAGMDKNFQDAQYLSGEDIDNDVASDAAFSSTYFRGATGNQVLAAIADLKLTAVPSMSAPLAFPTAGSPLTGAAKWDHANLKDAYFDSGVTYLGAFAPTETATANWTSGWANFDPQNTDY